MNPVYRIGHLAAFRSLAFAGAVVASAMLAGAAPASLAANAMAAPPLHAAAGHALEQCVEIPVVDAKRSPDTKAVGESTDIGNITVMELDGDYGRGVTPPRQAVAQRFYQEHPDNYDFLIVYTTFEFETGDAAAFYNALRNPTAGIGWEQFDLGNAFGSPARLQGYLDMAAVTRWSFDPTSPRFDFARNTLAHELMHRWVAKVSYRTAGGADSPDLLGKDDAHWSYFLDTDASVMYGSDWQQRADGRYEAINTRYRYGPLDLYLAGFAAPGEVPPMTLIRGGEGDHRDLPRLGAITPGTAEEVRIEQIIAAEGARVPDVTTAQKDFRAALILLKRPGEFVPVRTLAALENVRVRFQQHFSQITDGRASLRIFNERLVAGSLQPALPQILVGSGVAPSPPGLTEAVAWLKSRQQVNGQWQDRPATALRDTQAVVRLLENVDPGYARLAEARAWLAAQPAGNVEQQQWKLAAGDGAALPLLAQAQSAAGGWGLAQGFEDAPLDTAAVTAALAAREGHGDAVQQALLRLGGMQNSDGSFGAAARGRGQLLPTLRAAQALSYAGAAPQLARRDAALQWLQARQQFDGGFGAPSQLADSIELHALLGQLPLDPASADAARDYVRNRQEFHGDWQGSVYLTALAAYSQVLDQKVNLAAGGTPAALPAAPLDGDDVLLTARIVNNGTISAIASVARWYDGDPDQGGVQIGADIAVPPLFAGSAALLQQRWDSSGRAGARTLWLQLDATGVLDEQNEADNRIAFNLQVDASPQLADIVLDAPRFSLDPAAFNQLPATVTLSGTVRNIGNTPVSAARLRLYSETTPPQMLAETTLDLPARGSAPLSLSFDVSAPATLRLLLHADPDNALNEARKDNNELRLLLPYGPSLDLQVLPADIGLADASQATLGQDATLRVRAHNRGTLDSPPAQLRVVVVQGAMQESVFDANVQIAAGQSIERRILWRPRSAGAAQLQVNLDPANQIAELDEDNNSANVDFNVDGGQGADLFVLPESLVFTPSPAQQGQPLQLSLQLRNQGVEDAGPFKLALYASDPRQGGSRLAETLLPGLASGAQTTALLQVAALNLSNETPVFVAADADQAIVESDEGNNLTLRNLLVVPFADVAVSAADIELTPSQPVPGVAQQARVRVRNIGGQSAAGFRVRLLEGGAQGGSAAGADILVDALLPGAETTLTWNWTFGLQTGARQLSVVADSEQVLHENDTFNNTAVLPVAAQDGSLYASELYISPNGDGVRDSTTVHFARPGGAGVTVQIHNAADYLVREFGAGTDSAASGQLIWDGRDQRGRVVADGSYRISALQAGLPLAQLGVVVDTNRSSLASAIGTPLLVDSRLSGTGGWFQPPLTEATRHQLFTQMRPASALALPDGIYRAHTLLPGTMPVISSSWMAAYLGASGGGLRGLFGPASFSPDGRWAVVEILKGSDVQLAIAATTQSDQVSIIDEALMPDSQLYQSIDPRFIDDRHVIAGHPQHQLWIYDVQTRARTAFRSLPADTQRTQVFPHGIYVWSGDSFNSLPSHYYPADPQRPPHAFAFDAQLNYNSQLNISADGRHALIYRFGAAQESLHLFQADSGEEQLLLQREPEALSFPQVTQPDYRPTLQAQWVSLDSSILLIDSLQRRVRVYTLAGTVRTSAQLPPVDESLVLGADEDGFFFSDYRRINARFEAAWSSADAHRQPFDPVRRRATVLLASQYAGMTYCEGGPCAGYRDATLEAFAVDTDDGSFERIAAAQTFAQLPATLLPRHTLRDGGVIETGQHYRPAGGSLSAQPWPEAAQILDNTDQLPFSGDDSGVLLWPPGLERHHAASAGNLGTYLRAEALERAIQLSGVAADHNFSHYQLDWAAPATPTQWNAITTAQHDPVIGEDFLYWIPPQPGQYLLRLSVFDLAGNISTSYASALSVSSSPLGQMSIDYRYFSPNGDGLQDTVTARFQVRLNAQITLRIRSAAGQLLREQSLVMAPGMHEYVWDGRDSSGVLQPDGSYTLDLHGTQLKIVLDNTAPQIKGDYTQPYYPFVYADGSTAVGSSLRAAAWADDANPGAKLYLQLSDIGANEWRDQPRNEFDSSAGTTSAEILAGKELRAIATDRAGNRATRAFGRTEPQLHILAAGKLPLLTPLRHDLEPLGWQPPAYPLPPDYPANVMEYIADPSAPYTLLLEDLSAGFSAIDIEIASAQAPGNWTVLTSRPGTLPPFVHLPGRRLHLDLSWQGQPIGADLRLRPVGIRADGSRVPGNQLRVVINGFGAPVVVCPDDEAESVQLPPELKSLLNFAADRPIQIAVQTHVPNLSEHVGVELYRRNPDRINGAVKIRRNDAGAVYHMPAEDRPADPLLTAYDRGASIVHLSSGRRLKSQEVNIGCKPPIADVPSYRLGIFPVIDQRCGSAPTGKVLTSTILENLLPAHAARLALRAENQERLIYDETGLQNEFIGGFWSWKKQALADIAGLPQGEATALLKGLVGSVPFLGMQEVPVDHDPPLAELFSPSPGSRVCALRDEDGLPMLELTGQVSTNSKAVQRFTLGRPDAPPGSCRDPITDASVPGPCLELAAPQIPDLPPNGHEVTFTVGSGQDYDLAALNGPVKADLRAADWSGATVCASSEFFLDSKVEIGEAGPPGALIWTARPLILEDGWTTSARVLGLSQQGYPRYRKSVIRLAAGEPVDYRLVLYRATRLPEPGPPVYRIGAQMTQLAAADAVSGSITLEWDGLADGAAVIDGEYVLAVHASDGCGWKRDFHYVVEVDSTAPEVQISEPAAGQVPVAAVIEISGIVDDAHFSSFPEAEPYWQLKVTGSEGYDLVISDGLDRVPETALLGRWNRGNMQTAGHYVLRALDDYGNSAQVEVSFVPPTPLTLLGGARLQPDLFSPNGDGRLDATAIDVQLLAASTLDVRVRNAQGAVVAELAQGASLPAGPARFDWNGSGPAGVAADGAYVVDIVAHAAADPGYSENAQLSLSIDTTAPALTDLTPAGAYARAQDSAGFTLTERHPDRYDARLIAVAAGSVIAQSGGANTGPQQLTALDALAEGDYRLEVQAQDRAGNRAEASRAFTLDRTPPELALSAPAEGALLKRNLATALTGTARDAHFASYTVAIASTDVDNWTDIAGAASAVDNGPLGSWAVTQADGDYRLRLRGEDLAGNSAQLIRRVSIDGTPPAVAITAPADGAALRENLRVQGTASDAHLRDYALSIATPSGVLANQWTPLFRGTASVEAGLLADIGLPLPDGDYTLRLVATDQLGHSSSTQVNLRLDRQPPPAPLQLRGRLDAADAILDWNPANAGDVAGYALYRNGERINPALLAQPHHVDAGLRDGSWRYHVTALDRAGNESAPSNSVQLLLDRTPPEVALRQPQPGARLHGLAAVIGTAWSEDDFERFTLTARRSDGSDAPQQIAQGSLPLRDARLGDLDTLAWPDEIALTLRLEARDTRGNAASAEVQIVIDNGPPAAPQNLTAVLAGQDGQVAWDPNSEADLLGYLLYRNGQLVNGPAELPADLRGYALAAVNYQDADLPDGTHTYVVFAIDQAGNISPPSAPATLDPVNFGPPDLDIETPQDNAAFEQSIAVRAISRDRDIDSVQFAWRAVGGSSWTDLGAAFSSMPYQLTWTPGALPYGEYEIRGLARDTSGLQDPQPPVVRVRYADLTPPAAPSNLRAVADGDTVQLSWTAAPGDDVAGYRVERYDNGWQALADESTATTRSDAGLAPGYWQYRVRALDAAGNLSAESADSAEVFNLTLQQPFTPTTAAAAELRGHSPLAGDISYSVAGGAATPAGSSDASGAFLITGITLQSGENEIVVRLTSADGDRSLPAALWVTRATPPSAPTGLALQADSHDVQVSWNANPEADVLGYRLQHNGGLLPADALLDSGVSSQSDTCCDAGNAADGDAGTAWTLSGWLNDVEQQSDYDPVLDISLDQPHIVTALQIEWQTAAQATGNLDLLARTTRGAWVRVAGARGAPAAIVNLTLDQPYRSDALRLVLRSPSGEYAYAELALAEVRVRERVLINATDFSQSVVDGVHRYRVAAVNAAALQSDWSALAEIGIGDTQPPDAPVLSGALQDDNDASLSWTASSAADVTRYELSRDGTVIANVPAAQPRTHLDANLALGSYSYQVIAYDAFDNASAPSNSVTLTVAGSGPGIPTGVRVDVPPEGSALDVRWNAGDGTPAVAYVLRRATAQAGPFVEIATIPATARHDTGLSNGVTYYYTVEAIDAAGNRSGQSAPASGTPRDSIAPPAPLLTHATLTSLLLQTDRDRSLVCGLTEAGALVSILREGQATADVLAAASHRIDYPSVGAHLLYGLQPAADGQHAAVQNNGVTLFNLRDGSTTALGADTRQPWWSAHGATLYYADNTQIFARRPGRPAQALPWQADSLQGFALSADEERVLLLGSYTPAGGSGAEGVWWLRRDGSAARRIAGVELADLLTPAAQLSANARYAVLPTLDGQLRVLDLPNAVLRDSFAADVSIRPGWSPDSRRLAFVRTENSTTTVWLYDAQTRQLSALFTPSTLTAALAWSPDGAQLALLDNDGRIEWRSPADASLLGQLQTGSYSPAPETFAWTASGHIVFVASRNDTGVPGVVSVQPAGWFCSAELDLRPGMNTFSAFARDAAGNASVPAQTIRIELTGAQLPDLSLSASDVFFVPAAPAPGQAVTALVTLRNLGAVAVNAPELRALLLEPSGASRDVSPSAALAPLGAGEARSLSLGLGTLGQPGIYRLRLLADPAGKVNEADETNNAAEGQLALSLNADPLIDVSTSSSLYAPGETLVGEIRVSNPGASFSGRVRASIVDAANALVADLGESTLTELGYAQRWTRAVDWRAAGVFAGDYRLRARLLRSDGSLLSEQSAAFAIRAQRHITLDIAAEPRVQRSGLQLAIASSLHFVDGNALLVGASLRASVHDANGAEVWASTQALGVLEPGYQMRKEDLWNTAGQPAGVYTLRLRLQSADEEASAESSVTLTDDNGLRLGGAITLLPAQQLIAGQAGSLVYRVDNGGSALSGVELRLEVYQSLDQPALVERFETIDLPAGASREARLDVTAPPLALRNHVAVLSARAGSEPWRLIARQGFPVIDALPPAIQPRLPRDGQLQPAVVMLRADITDAHSAIAQAEVRIDGGGWQPVSRAASGAYERNLSGLADGPHQLTWRARDSWGNEASSASLPFEVDATPPLIEIAGVSEGQLSNQVLSPTVTLSDAHLDAAHSLIQLDGQPYVSGTPIGADGEHTLAVRAVDSAGNQSLAAVHFRIDRTPPALAIVQPADGSISNVSAIDVQVQSEALATITLQAGSYQAQTAADAAGLALFAAVPLLEGDNRIEASAHDAAGNSSGPLAVTVRFETTTPLPLVGTLQPALAEVPHGQPLVVQLRLRNPGSQALPVQTLRLGVQAAGGAQLAQRDYARPFAAGEEFTDTAQFDTMAWALGNLDLRLEILREGSWQLLDTQGVALVDRTPPQLQALAPLAGSVLRTPLRLRASAGDALSPPVTVEASVDDGPWTALAASATPGEFESSPLKLPDGAHRHALRARDAAGNETVLPALGFIVDNSAPLIAISGVADGDLLNRAVTPLITISDANLAQSGSTLNGQPYASGTPVSTSGAYVLSVSASDAAGNSAAQELRFTLDLDAPLVTVTEPLAGSTVSVAAQQIAGTTEPLADVHVQAPGLSTTVPADANGVFRTAAATLKPGPNTLRLYATDRAGNTGPETTLTVTYQEPAGQQLSALFLGTPYGFLRGQPIDARYVLRNTGTLAFSQVPVRVRLSNSGGAEVAEDSFSLDLAGQSEVTRNSAFISNDLPVGRYRLTLSAQLRDGQGQLAWVQLAETTADLRTGCRLPHDRIFADGFDLPDLIWCDSFDPPLPPKLAPAAPRTGRNGPRQAPLSTPPAPAQAAADNHAVARGVQE